jgi:hypothetical protein
VASLFSKNMAWLTLVAIGATMLMEVEVDLAII